MAFSFYRRSGGDCVAPVKVLPAAGSQSFRRGDPVNHENGLCTVGAAADTAFVGIANETKTTAAAGGTIEVVLGLPDVEFKVPYDGSGSLTALTNAHIGTAFDLGSDDIGIIDLDDAVGGAWIVVAYDNTAGTAIVVLDREKASVIVGGHTDDVGSSGS